MKCFFLRLFCTVQVQSLSAKKAVHRVELRNEAAKLKVYLALTLMWPYSTVSRESVDTNSLQTEILPPVQGIQ